MRNTTISAAIGLVLATALFASSAMAQNTRSFVSPTGNDSNACTLLAPCRNFQPAYNRTNPGGEIAVLGTAGYGPLVIGHAISIVNAGGFEAGIFVGAGGAGITINAGPNDAVVLRGLTINGGGVGYNGIVFNSGASLTIDGCVVQAFHFNNSSFGTGNGILLQPTSGTVAFSITNTTLSNNGLVGIYFAPPSGSPSAEGVIDHIVASGNQDGIEFDISAASGGVVNAAISNSITSDNTNVGIYFHDNGSGALSVSIDNLRASGNNFGVLSAGGNTFYTYQNNRINLNNVDVSGTLTPVTFN